MVSSTMGHCISVGCHRRRRKKIILLLVGLDNAGKTCTAKCLLKEPRENIAPTVGFSIVKPNLTRHDVTLYDLGGGQRIRGIWKSYFSEAYGLIFVCDASDSQRLDECKQVLQELVEHPSMSGKPILLLANKQDCSGALDEVDICEALGLETTVNKHKCRTKVETCSATYYKGKKFDRAILKGFQWLVATVVADYEALSARVQADMKAQKEVQEIEQKERMERIRKLREEREKLEGKDKDAKGEGVNGTDEMESLNPFRPIEDIKRELEKTASTSGAAAAAHGSAENGGHSSITQPPSPANEEMRPPLINGFMKGAGQNAHNAENEHHVGNHDAQSNKPKKKKKRFGRNNKTAPLVAGNDAASAAAPAAKEASLPPLQFKTGNQILVGVTNTGLDPIQRPPSGMKHSWGLAEELEPVETEHSIR